MNVHTIPLLVLALGLAPAVYAEEPDAGPPAHDEGAMFGAPVPDPSKPVPAPGPARTETAHEPAATGDHARVEGSLFGNSAPGDATPAQAANDAVPEDPLKLGGTLYLRAQATGNLTRAGDSLQAPSNWALTLPNLLDVYLDARPNDRVRGFVVGRLTFNPAIDPNLSAFGQPKQSQVNAFLDQMWINTDIAREVFVTAGKQHVKWGTGHFWNPTDFLQPVRLDPLAVFDERTGVTMVKAHVPWEKEGWNFYGFGVLEETNVVNTVGRVGGAGRAEIVLGPAEIGFDGALSADRKPRYGIDISSGLGPLDVYAEAAFHDPRTEVHYRLHGDTFTPQLGLQNFETFHPSESLSTQVTAGASWQTTFRDNDAFTLGGEYFYNPLGSDNPELYPYLLLKNQFTPFYLGQHYAGVYASLLIPTASFASNAFTLSTLGNLSDRSFVSRLDYSITVLTHLRLEAYGDVHYGNEGGEFRFGVDTASLAAGNGQIPLVFLPTPAFDVGLALRISI